MVNVVKESMKIKSFVVNRKENGMQLLEFLSIHLGISRKKAKKLLDARDVVVNQRRIWMTKHALQEGQEVVVKLADDAGRGKSSAVKIPILFEKGDVMVINKPAGYLSNGKNSVEELLRRQKKNPELRVVHRLDKDTSGCLLAAGNDDTFTSLVELFRFRELTKMYHVIVSGRLIVDEKTINRSLEGKQAVTGLKTLDSCTAATHLSAKIDTGRTHQIRQHLAEIHHPVLGDKQYGTKRKTDFKEFRINRQMLHASKLVFKHPASGGIVRAEAPLPVDFKSCLHTFGLT